MLAPPTSIIQEIHKLHRTGAVIYLLEVHDHDKYLALNIRDVVWNGRTWVKSYWEFETIQEDENHAPEFWIHLSNVGGFVEQDVVDNDNYKRAWVTFYVVSSACLDETEAIYSIKLQVMKVACKYDVVSFKLGLENPLMMLWLAWKLHGSICQYSEFKGDLCGYSGAYTSCNRSLIQCIARGNEERFGAQLGLKGEMQDDDGL